MAVVFFSYSHKDEELRDELETHLSILKRQGVIQTWHDRRIVAGDELDGQISENLESADIVLLLVSSYFLNSNYCYDLEMRRAMERHDANEARVIPIVLRPCDWQSAPFGKLMAVPKDGKPVTKYPDMHEAFLEIAQEIRRATAAFSRATPEVSAQDHSSPEAAQPNNAPRAPRSSKLQVKKSFTERDKDEHRENAFDYIMKFFENSLTELSERNPQIESRFRRIDANSFTAAVYEDGRKITDCTIRLGGFAGGITFSIGENANSNSFNESLSVEHDDNLMFLKPMGMGSPLVGSGTDAKLTFEGAAEYYWAMLMRPLQR